MRHLYPQQVCEAIYGVLIFFTALLTAVLVKALFSFISLLTHPRIALSTFSEGLVVVSVPLVLCIVALDLYYLVKYEQFLIHYQGGEPGQRLVDHAIIILPLNVCALACGSFLFFI